MATIRQSRLPSSLRSIRLSGCSIGSAGAQDIAASLKGLPQLQTLCLSYDGIGDSGAAAIAGSLKDVPQLQTF
jgi:hypothetical protein